ncbi:30S ribosomal protein S17e [archaeon SCG-AAA382B04]|nr:30S ribosomal protein S17e [archaeon SCG-AAA382B04]
MGRSRPTFIRNIGKKLIEYHGEKFSEDFEENKEKVDELTDISSKRVRNRIAGFIASQES